MDDANREPPAARRKKEVKKIRSLSMTLAIYFLAGPGLKLLLLVLFLMLYMGFLKAWAKGPSAEKSLWNFFLLLLPAVPPIALLMHWVRDQQAYGKKLYAKRRYAKARRVLAKVREESSYDTVKLLGDMYMDGLGGKPDPDKAVECYAAALHSIDWEARPEGGGPWADPDGWLAEVLARIQPGADAGKPAALELAAEILYTLGCPEEALAAVRHLPDDDGKPGWQTECLTTLIRKAIEPFWRGDGKSTDADAPEELDIGVPVNWKSSFRLFSLPWLGVCLASFIPFILCMTGGNAGAFSGVALLALPGVCCYVFFRIRRWGYYGLGKRCLARGKYDVAAQFFTRGVEKRDPRAAKLLGDMHQYGWGVEQNRALALAGYQQSYVMLQTHQFIRSLEFRALLRPKFYMREADLCRDLCRSVTDLLASGHDANETNVNETYDLLFLVLREAKDWKGIREFSLRRQETHPDVENVIRFANAALEDPDADEKDVAAALETLERFAEQGLFMVIVSLAAVYGGCRDERLPENLEKAHAYLVAAFAAVDSQPEGEHGYAANSVRSVACDLIERHGAVFLEDRLCLTAMMAGKSDDPEIAPPVAPSLAATPWRAADPLIAQGVFNAFSIAFILWFAGALGYWLLMIKILGGDNPMSGAEMLLFLGPPMSILGVLMVWSTRRDEFKVGEKHLERGDTVRAVKSFSKACAGPDARAAKRLGDVWRTGVEGKIDLDKALNAYDKAATSLQAARERRAENWVNGNPPFPQPKAGTAEFLTLVDELVKSLGDLSDLGVIGADGVLARVNLEREGDE